MILCYRIYARSNLEVDKVKNIEYLLPPLIRDAKIEIFTYFHTHTQAVIPQFNSGTNYPKLEWIPQVKSIVPNKTALISDACCEFRSPQASDTYD